MKLLALLKRRGCDHSWFLEWTRSYTMGGEPVVLSKRRCPWCGRVEILDHA